MKDTENDYIESFSDLIQFVEDYKVIDAYDFMRYNIEVKLISRTFDSRNIIHSIFYFPKFSKYLKIIFYDDSYDVYYRYCKEVTPIQKVVIDYV